MKNITLILVLWLANCLNVCAQRFEIVYTHSSAIEMKSILVYDKDANGSFYPVKETRYYDKISGNVTFYAYDKKKNKLYVNYDYGNYVFTLTKDGAKIIKKKKNIPRLSGDELAEAIEATNEKIRNNVKIHNDKIKKALEDSVREQARKDSIAHAIELAKYEKKKEEYRKNKNWQFLPLGGASLKCELCNEYTHNDINYVVCFAIRNDSIFYGYTKSGIFDIERNTFHVAKFSDDLKKNSAIAFHYEAFKDSLQQYDEINKVVMQVLDDDSNYNYWETIEKIAPYGYIDEWSWSRNYSCVNLYFTYTNLNKKTIRYMDIYVTAFNDVGDVRGTGHFSGTGPIEYNHRGGWDWDDSYFYVANDVTELRISKIVITYMDRTKKVLTGKSIIIK